MSSQRLARDPENAMLGGVCAGVAARYNQDATLVRVVAILLTVLTSGVGILVYVAAWIVMPRGQDQPSRASRDEITGEIRDVGDRLAESARIIGRSARTTASEVSEVVRRPRTTPKMQPPPDTASQEETIQHSAVPTEGGPGIDPRTVQGESQQQQQQQQ